MKEFSGKLFTLAAVPLAKETLEYAKSLLTETSVETMNAINEFGNAVKEWRVCSTKRR